MASRRLSPTYAFATSIVVLAFNISAQAGASRTFVSTTGNDSNISGNCSAAGPCRTFTGALSVTNPGGEVVVLTSGGYGPAMISQPVIITATGVDASISVTTSPAAGLTINTPGNVTLIGLNLHGEATGIDGIEVQEVGFLRLYNMLVENFTDNGVDFEVSGHVAIYGSLINDNGNAGLEVDNPSASAYVRNTSFGHNYAAVQVLAGQVTVSDSSAEYSNLAFGTAGGTVSLFNDRAVFNTLALAAISGGIVNFANCLIANNAIAYSVASGSTIAGTTPGSSLIAPGQGTSGTLGTAVGLQ